MAYGIAGFVVGAGAAALTRWLLGGGFAAYEAVMFGFWGGAAALAFGQRGRRLPTAEDVSMMRLREEMSPLDLAADAEIPITLKTPSERTNKR